MKRRHSGLIILSLAFFAAVFVPADIFVISCAALQTDDLYITTMEMSENGLYFEWNGVDENCYLVLAYDADFEDIYKKISVGISSAYTFFQQSFEAGTTFYARIETFSGVQGEISSLTITPQYSYSVKCVNPYCEIYTSNSIANLLLYVETDTENQSFSYTVSNEDGESVSDGSIALQTSMFPDLEVSGWYSNGLQLPGGYIFEKKISDAGTCIVDVYEIYGNVKITGCATTSVEILDYDTAREAWLEEIIEESGASDDSLTDYQKMIKICGYLLNNYIYTRNSGSNGTYVSLYSERGTLWQKKQLHSLNSSSLLIELGEKLGITLVSGYTYTGDYSYHAYVVDEDGNFYCACNSVSTGTIDLSTLETISLDDVEENNGGHNFDEGEVLTQATCLTEGEILCTCRRCGFETTVNTGLADHSYGAGIVTREATCTQDGVISYTCSVCGARETEEITAAGHSFDDAEISLIHHYDSTCVVYTCSVCGIQLTLTSLYGINRYETSSDVAEETFESCEYAVIATGNNFPDALAAASLAGVLDAPVILVSDSKISIALETLETLGVTKAYIIGGTSAVSASAASQIQSVTGSIERIAGENRFETAIAIADKIDEILASSGDEASGTCIVASGAAFPDALSGSPYAYWSGSPIYLAKADGSLNADTLAAIEEGGYSQIIVLGGTSAVSLSAYQALETIAAVSGADVERLGGSNRYETSSLVAEWSVQQGMSYDGLAVATGTAFPDALAGSALCGRSGSVLLLSGATAEKSSTLLTVLEEHADDISQVYILGGTSAVSEEIREMIRSALGE